MPVKTSIDDLIQQLFDALLNSLRRNIVNHIQTIDTFVTEGMEALSTRPQTVEEIGLANAKHEELSKRIPEVSSMFMIKSSIKIGDFCDVKNFTLLLSVRLRCRHCLIIVLCYYNI